MMRIRFADAIVLALVCAAPQMLSAQAYKAPRTADGTPDLQGIWQVRNSSAAFDLQDHAGALGIPPGRSVIVDPAGGKIPYKPEALAKRQENFKNRAAADTFNKCYMPGVPRITLLDYPFQIFQTPNYTL